jgi:hypothetical protein
MNPLFEWVLNNKEWLFSGIGILLFPIILKSLESYFKGKVKQKMQYEDKLNSHKIISRYSRGNVQLQHGSYVSKVEMKNRVSRVLLDSKILEAANELDDSIKKKANKSLKKDK